MNAERWATLVRGRRRLACDHRAAAAGAPTTCAAASTTTPSLRPLT